MRRDIHIYNLALKKERVGKHKYKFKEEATYP
jgi:hypothetical protein